MILVILLFVFGAGKLPQVARDLGQGMRNFQRSVRGEDEGDDKKSLESDDDTTS